MPLALLRRALVLAWLLVTTQFALALDTGYSLSQYQHTVWSERDGAPTNVVGMGLADDGYLWMASARGVWRFDGFDFMPMRSIGGMAVDQQTVTALFNGPSKALFFSFGTDQGSALYAGGRLVRFPGCTLTPGSAEVDGVTWLICNGRLGRLSGVRIEPIGKESNLPDGAVTMLANDAHGAVWVSVAGQLWTRPNGASAFRLIEKVDVGGAVPGPDDTLWSAGAGGITVTRVTAGVPGNVVTPLRGSFGRLHFDKDGGLWAVDTERVLHVGDPRRLAKTAVALVPQADVMTKTTGLGSDTVTALFEDDRGSIWLATAAGVERFKDNYFYPVKLPGRSLAASIAAGDEGSIWAGSYTSPLMQITASGVRRFDAIKGGVTSLARDRDGTVWVAAEQGRLFQVHGETITRDVDVPPEIHGSAITGITKDVHGALWVGATINGVVGCYADGRWTMPRGYGGLPERWASRTILADHRGRLWASRHYDVMLLQDGVATEYSAAQGLEVGDIYALSERGDRIWVGGSQGVAYFDGQRFQAILGQADAFSDVTGVLETASGDLWVHGFSSAVKVPAAELEKQRRHHDYKVATERYDALDGLYGNSPQLAARPSLVEATDGRIWFSTSEGVAAVDPKRPRPAPHAAPVVVQGVYVDGVERDLSAPLVLQHRTKSVRFLYAAVSPYGGERLRFRYRLEGLDSDWTDAGSRRAITYNSLLPGKYQFRVESSDDRGSWVANDRTLPFTVEPLWYETLSFRLAYVLVGALGLWVVYRWQVQRTTRRVRLQMRVQQMERERIARDLHDTLLQGVQALIWRIHGIAAIVPQGGPVRCKLEDAIDRTEGLLAESRQRVMILREKRSAPLLLSEALKNVVSNAASSHPFSHTNIISGDEVPVDEVVQVDVCDIVREALINAAQHGNANSVEVRVRYSPQDLVVTIIDDGVGFDPQVALRGRKGHWGIAGMRERARELGGSLQIRTQLGKGTEVTLKIRARRAFGGVSAGAWLPRAKGMLLAMATSHFVRNSTSGK